MILELGEPAAVEEGREDLLYVADTEEDTFRLSREPAAGGPGGAKMEGALIADDALVVDMVEMVDIVELVVKDRTDVCTWVAVPAGVGVLLLTVEEVESLGSVLV